MKNKILSNDVGVTLGGGSIEHPLSIHSASIGTRWKPRGLQLICTLVLLFTLAIGNVWAAEIFSTDVLASVSSATVSQDKGAYTTGTATSWSDPYENYFATSGSAGYYQLAFSTPISLTGYTDVKVNVYWGTTSNRPLNMTINGGSATKIDEVTASVDRSKLRVAEGAVSVSSISSLKLSSSGGGGVHLFRIEIVGTPSGGGGGDPVDPTLEYNAGAYTIGATALDLSSCIKTKQSTGAITYTVKTDGGTSATITGTSFTAENAGTCVVTASQAEVSGTYNAASADFNVVVSAAPVIEPTGTATISYALSGSTTTGTVTGVNSISSLSSSLTLSTLTLSGTKDGYSGAIKGCTSTTELVEADYVDVQFTVGSGYVFTPSAVTVQVNPFTATGAVKAVVKVMDAQPLVVASEVLSCAKSTDNAVTFASGAFTNKKFEGTVHLRMYFYGPASDKTFYLKSPISITGTVAVAPTKYNVNFDKNDEGAGGSQATLKYEAGAEVTLPACTFDAPTGKEFDAWTSTDVTITDGKFTMPSNAVTIKATWKTSSTKYTVTYKEGETTLDTEDVVAGTAPTGYSALESKSLASFVAWYSDPDLAEGHKIADMSAETVSEATTYYGKWNYQYAASANIEQWVLDNNMNYDAVAQLGTLHYSSNISNSLDSLNDDPSKTNRNYAYLGLKIKASGKMLDFRLANGQTVKVKLGATGNYPQVALNGGDYAAMSLTDNVWTYTAEGADAYISIKTANNNTVVIKQVMINEDIAAVTLPWRVTYNANGGTCATAEAIWSGAALTLPDVTPAVPADYTFAGWYDEEIGGELKGVAGASYTPADNETLFAHFAPVEYAVNYAAGDHGSGDMAAANVGWGTVYTAVANGFTPETGYIFAGWAVSGVDGVSSIAAGGSFTMPKNEVTLTALWDDVSKVAVIVETNVKYESLADAVAAATDGQTIMLLQNNNVTAQVEVAGKAITLDLAGYKIEYTGTSILPSGVILVHNGASLTIDDSSDPDAGSIVAGNDAYAAVALTKAGDNPANPAVLVVNGGTLIGYYYGITGHGSRPNTEITINGGTITATAFEDNLGIYHPQDGTLTVNGGTITAYASAIEMRAGTLVINGGTFTATAPAFSCNPNGSGTTTVGAAIAIAQHTTKTDIAVTINGGTFEGVKAVNESNPQVNDPAPQVAMAITGGTFTGEVTTVDVDHFVSGGIFDHEVTNAQCAENYVPKDNGDGTYGVKPKEGAVIIGADMVDNDGTAVEGINPIGAYYGAVTAKLKNLKVNSSGYYIGLQLTAGQTFQKGDVLNLHTTTAATQGKIELYEEATGTNLIWATDDAASAVGDNKIVLTDAVNGYNALYIVRKASSGDQSWNGYVDHVEVTRPMQPMLTAFSVDGRDGVIDEVNKTVAVNIPFEADLDNLTIVDEVVWNAPAASDAKVVTTNSGAWVEDPATNTYRLTDKDGDYTDYIITLTRDVLKHTVSFNTHGGSAVDAQLVEDGENPVAPSEPTKEDYLFQGWAETEDGAIVDVTTFAITADKEFHAVWTSDGAIKLLDGEGNINTTNFITGVTATTVTINEVEHKAAAWGGTQGAISGTNQLGKIVQYNATTNSTKIKVSVYNTNSSPKQVYLHKILEGETTAVVETLAVASKGNAPVESEYYEFNSDANRSFYLTTNSTDVKIVQVKVIESGDVTLKRAGEAGYELNLNKGRVLAYANTDINFEGLAFTASSNYGVISSSELQIKAPLSFTISSPVTLTLNNNSNKYQVSQSISGSGDEYAAGEQVLDLTTTGTWYIVPTTTSAVKLTSIAFALPKCKAPVFGTMEDIELCATEAIPAIDGTATVSDGGDVTYKWYEEGSETVLATTATYTPATDGSYFVVATNSLAGHQDVSTTSDVVKVSHFASVAITTAPEDVYKHAGLDAELSVVAEGKNVTYEWFTCDDELGTNPVAIVPAETGASLNLTAIEAGIKYYQVVVTDECGTTASAVAKVEGFNDIALVDVTGDMFWDFSKANDGTAATSSLCNEAVLVNVPGIVNNSDFESDNIMATANKFASGKLQASMIKFHTTVNGLIKVIFSNTGSKTSERYLVVNGQKTASGSKNSTAVTYYGFVPAGDVELTVVDGDGNMLNFTSVKFTAKAAPDYVRDDDWMAPGELGTICIPQGAVAVGAGIFELVGKNSEGKIAFDIVEHMEPGKPYLFRSNSNKIDFYYTDEAEASEPDNSGAMKGSFTDYTIYEGLSDIYYFNGTALWCADALGYLNVIANRAYVQMSEVTDAPAPNYARRRITMSVNGTNATTGFENIEVGNEPMKIMLEGKLYILRGEQVFDATGRLVK